MEEQWYSNATVFLPAATALPILIPVPLGSPSLFAVPAVPGTYDERVMWWGHKTANEWSEFLPWECQSHKLSVKIILLNYYAIFEIHVLSLSRNCSEH